MNNLLKKLHIMPNQPEDVNGLVSSKGSRLNEGSSEKMSPSRSSPSRSSPSYSEQKPFSSLTGWLSSVGNRHSPSPPSSSNVRIGEMKDSPDSVSSSDLGVLLDITRQDSKSDNSRDPEVDEERQIQLALEMSAREDPKIVDLSISRDQEVEEEYQIQLALEISAREDPEAVQIEAVKQISLASCPPQNTPAEIIAYRYWNYDALSYDDKILDGFYDLYGILADSSSAKMPSLVDLLGTSVSDTISWEAVLVDRASDANLIKLEQKALVMTVESRSEFRGSVDTHLVQKLATLVADYMGGPVGSPESMLKAWRDLSNTLRETLNSMVLPLGYLTIGLARHRALLIKVLADSIGIPCRLMKGHQHNGSDAMAVNIVRTDDISREYIIDLMADPGTLIPFDAAATQIEYGKPFFAVTPSLRDVDFTRRPSSSGVVRSIKEYSEFDNSDNILSSENHATSESDLDNRGAIDELQKVESSQESLSNAEKCEVEAKVLEDSFRIEKALVQKSPKRPSYPHARSPSWTEGISSPAVRRMKVKDVSQYMIDAAKENPDLAQKLHDVLLESGVVAPPNLFSEIYTEQRGVLLIEDKKRIEDKEPDKDRRSETRRMGEPELGAGQYSVPLPFNGVQSIASPPGDKLELKPVEGLDVGSPQNLDQLTGLPVVAVSAASTEAVVASSVVGAAVKSSTNTDVEAPVAAAAASRQSEHGVQFPSNAPGLHQIYFARSDKNSDVSGCEPQGTSGREHVESPGAERSSHRLAGNDSTKSDIALNDVAEWEIPWEEITLGERIGLGSCGEVYRGDWHETVVQRFQELFSQTKYKEAAELAAESPQGILRTPDTVAKFQSCPVQTGQTPPLLQYFGTLLTRGKLNIFESLELSRLVVNQNKMYLLENWLAEDKLECSEELGDLVKTVDNDLALKIYIKARATPRVVAAFTERREFDKILIYSKQEKEERLDGDADEDERRAKSKSFIEPSGTIFREKVPQKLERMNEQSIQGSNASFYSVEVLMRELAFEKAKRYSFDELATFTSKFDNKIGSGAFGIVYKGQFSDGTEVAVKVLKMYDFVHHSFLTEIRTIGKTDHRNLIKLIGFCLEENMLALVYEYMENGSLDMILYKKPLTLEWDKLYAIAVELANALAYLHHDCGDQIIHHDIKASNVLLDSNYLPKLSDFGLANLKDMERTHLTLTKCRGTPGYAAPEIWMPFSPITSKCDVYSFGMILFEILGAEKNNRTDIWFPSHVWEKFNSGTLDDLMMECGISEKDREKAMILSLVALWCAQFTPQTRPSMSTVATVLKNKILVKRPPNPFLPSDSSDPMQPV